MKVPDFQSLKAIDKEGNFTTFMQVFFDTMTQQMQNNLSDDGFVIPGVTTSQISNITNPSNPNAKGPGTMWYDTQAQAFKGNVNGVIKTFNMT